MTILIKLFPEDPQAMKCDLDLKVKILEKIGIYSSRFGISEPRVLLTTREVLDMPKEITGKEDFGLQILGGVIFAT